MQPQLTPSRSYSAFTLIELSIVLVIIALVAGGVLVGRDLIKASEVRAQISQFEQIRAAANTFRVKFGSLPGDIPASQVTQFAFPTIPVRSGTIAEGDGNGLIEGICCSGTIRGDLMSGERAWFWVDIANNTALFPGKYTANPTPNVGCGGPSQVATMLPAAKIGTGNYVTIISISAANWLTLMRISVIDGCGTLNSGVTDFTKMPLTISQASAIDKKIDDGFPQTGAVQAFYYVLSLGGDGKTWANGAGTNGPSDTSATAGTPTTCFDNNNVSGATQQYSLTQNNGNGLNCALSFKFQ